MKVKILVTLLLSGLLAGTAAAVDDAAELFSALERRLQSLKSLEIQYEATGAGGQAEVVEGRMVWIRPDRFYHDTPEWTFCEVGGEQWRHLKTQNTLIRESVAANSNFQPERMLFDLKKSARPTETKRSDDGGQTLVLSFTDPNLAGSVEIEFPAGETVPEAITFQQADGSAVRYAITRWNENAQPDMAIFTAPDVPVENVIDFRSAGKDR